MGRTSTRSVVIAVAVCVLWLSACSSNGPKTSGAPTASGSSVPASSAGAPSSPGPSQLVASAPAVSASGVHITVAKTQVPIPNGGGTNATIDEPTVVGAPQVVTETLQNAAAEDLAAFGTQLQQLGCAGNSCKGCSQSCSTPIFSAQWTSGRADSTIVSGRWTFTTYFPGAAHPYDAYQSLIIDGRTGRSIDPWALFTNASLAPLSDAAKPLLLKAVNGRSGCTVERGGFTQQAFDSGVAPKPEDYQGVAVVASGLAVAMPPGQISSEACGGFDVVVAWGAVRTSLSSLGQAVATGQPLPTRAAPAADVAPCKDGQVVVSLVATPATGVAGLSHQGVLLQFTPINTTACTLYGYPGVAGLDADGNQVLQATRTLNGYLGGVQSGKPDTVTISELSPASALVEGEATAPAGTTCPNLVALLVTPPGLHTSTHIEAAPAACSGLQVHPVVAGLTGDRQNA